MKAPTNSKQRKAFKEFTRKSHGVDSVEEETLQKLKQMLGVDIDRVEEEGEGLIVYVPKGQAAKAIGAGGCVARAVELVLGRKLTIKESV